MSQDLQPLNLQAWIDAHRDRLRPPVGNAQLWSQRREEGDFIVMVVGGPNRRTDYHIDPGDELFYQLEGSMELDVVHRTIRIGPGTMFLLPARVPHRPRRSADTVGLVVERRRRAGELDSLRWYCDGCHAVLHEDQFALSDITIQIRDAIARFEADESARTCPRCATVQPRASDSEVAR